MLQVKMDKDHSASGIIKQIYDGYSKMLWKQVESLVDRVPEFSQNKESVMSTIKDCERIAEDPRSSLGRIQFRNMVRESWFNYFSIQNVSNIVKLNIVLKSRAEYLRRRYDDDIVIHLYTLLLSNIFNALQYKTISGKDLVNHDDMERLYDFLNYMNGKCEINILRDKLRKLETI